MAVIIGISIFMIFILISTKYLLTRGAFNNDTGLMLCTYENPGLNQLLTAVPILLGRLGLNTFGVVAFRQIRFAVDISFGVFTYVAFSLWMRKQLGSSLGLRRHVATLLLFLVGAVQYPLQIVAWPFGHHDVLLWGTQLLMTLLFLAWNFDWYRVPVYFLFGMIAGLMLFIKPPTIVFYMLLLLALLLFSKGSAIRKFCLASAFLLGVFLFGIVYFNAVQDISAWREMVHVGLRRMDSLSAAFHKITFSTSLIDRILIYLIDLSNLFLEPLRQLGTSLVAAISFVAGGMIGYVALKIANRAGHRQRRLTMALTVIIATYTALFVWSVVQCLIALFSDKQVATYSMNVLFLYFLFGGIGLYCLSLYKDGEVLAKMRTFLLAVGLLAGLILAAHAGSNQALAVYAAEYFFVVVLWNAMTALLAGTMFPAHRNMIFVVIMFPVFCYSVRDNLSEIQSLYGNIDDVEAYSCVLPTSSRTRGLLVDPETAGTIFQLRKMLTERTDYRPDDLFFGLNNICLPVYLLGGRTLLCDSAYDSKNVMSSYYCDTVRFLHGEAVSKTFVLLNDPDVDVVISSFLIKFGCKFPEDYTLLGTCKTSDGTLLRLFSPNNRMRRD